MFAGNKGKIFFIFAALSYGILSIFYTYPLIRYFSIAVPGPGGDASQFIWALWHLKNSIIHLSNPFFTQTIYYPLTVSLILHTWTPLKCLFALPLTFIGNYISTYNSLILFSLVTCALGVYMLLRSYDIESSIAFIGGFAFAFSPFQMSHALGHLNIISTEAIPWIFYLWRSYNFNLRRIKLIGISLLTIYLFLSSYQLFIYLVIFTVSYLFWVKIILKKDINQNLIAVIKIGILFFIILIPFWILVINQYSQYNYFSLQDNYWTFSRIYSLDLISPLIFSPLNPLWGKYAQGILMRIYSGHASISNFNLAEHNAYISYAIWAVVIIGIIRYRKETFWRYWVFTGGIFWVLSLGPVLNIFGYPITANKFMHLFSFHGLKVIIPMPYILIQYLPFINGARVPARFYIITIFAVSIIFSRILYSMMSEIKDRRKLKYVIQIFLFLIIGVDYLPAPFMVTKMAVPSVYNVIKKDKDRHHVVLDLPSPPWAYDDLTPLFYQTYHQHQIVGGHTARESKAQNKYFWEYHIIKQISNGERGIKNEDLNNVLQKLNVYYIVARGDKVVETVRKEEEGMGDWEILSDGIENGQRIAIWRRSFQ